jgi:hypothetical protein
VNTSKFSERKRRLRKPIAEKPLLTSEIDSTKEKYFNICIIILLLVFGIYKAKIFFGAYPVPNPDFPGFLNVGRDILNFRMPTLFKRTPAVGIMMVSLGSIIGGMNPELTAGWILNDIFGVLSLIMLWLIGKQLIGKAAVWIAILAVLNPMTVRLELIPIAETSMVFFSLACFFFMFRHSNWAYVIACIGSMVRYECSALIFIVFLMDMVTKKTARQRILAFVYASIASLPLLLWLIGTKMSWEQQATSHYLRGFGPSIHRPILGLKIADIAWQTTFMPIIELPVKIKAMFAGRMPQSEVEAMQAAVHSLRFISKIIASTGFIFAVIYGAIKRNWKLLAIALFVILYLTAHSLKRVTNGRYTVPIMWAALLVTCCGLQYAWKTFNYKNWIPRPVIITLQVVTISIAGIWLFKLLPYIPKTAPVCVRAKFLPYVTLGVIATIILLRICFFRSRSLLRYITLSVVACLLLVSQHFTMASSVGNGDYNIEFKILADWYVENARPGEKLASTWAHILKVIASKYEDDFVSLTSLRGKTVDKIIQKCYDNDVTYVTWTARGSRSTRKGVNVLGSGAKLQYGKDSGPFIFLREIRVSPRRWIMVYRLLRPDEYERYKKAKGITGSEPWK